MSLEIAVFGGLGAFTVLLITGLLLWKRREKRRVAEALKAPVIRTPLAGPILNARVIAFALPMLVFSAAAGALTSKHGPISQSNVPFAITLGVVLLVGGIGTGVSAMRSVGTAELDRTTDTLRFSIRGVDRDFDLRAPFDYDEFSLPPAQLYPRGGTGLVLVQNGASASFWYMNESFRRPAGDSDPPLIARPPEELRSKDGIGRAIHEYVSKTVSSRTIRPHAKS